MLTILSLIVLAVLLLLAVQIFRIGWRVFHDNEELVAGGSWGRQLFGRRQDRKRS